MFHLSPQFLGHDINATDLRHLGPEPPMRPLPVQPAPPSAPAANCGWPSKMGIEWSMVSITPKKRVPKMIVGRTLGAKISGQIEQE